MELGAASDASGDAAESLSGLTLEDIRRRLRQHALWKIDKAERAAVLMLAGENHAQIRAQLGLTVEQYRHVRRWLKDAMSPEVDYEVPRPFAPPAVPPGG